MGDSVLPSAVLCALQVNRMICQVSSVVSHVQQGDSVEMDEEDVVFSSLLSMATKKAPIIEPEVLAKRWGIGLEQAKRTLERTTQRSLRTVAHPSLSRRFRMNDRQLRLHRLAIALFADTMIAKTKSRRGNKYAEVYAATCGWCRAFPMKLKSEAHETLSLLFARDGVPTAMIVDGFKEQTMGKFHTKVRDAECNATSNRQSLTLPSPTSQRV